MNNCKLKIIHYFILIYQWKHSTNKSNGSIPRVINPVIKITCYSEIKDQLRIYDNLLKLIPNRIYTCYVSAGLNYY